MKQTKDNRQKTTDKNAPLGKLGKRRSLKPLFLSFNFLIAFSLFFSTVYTGADVGSIPIKKNQILPLSSFTDILSQNHISYLGLMGKNKFSFKDIHGSTLIIELFSTYCMSCPKNYPVLNSIYNYVESNKELKDKVKVFGIAIGNTQDEINEHIKIYSLIFPVLTDYWFTFHKAIGSPRVPFTIIAKKITKNKIKVLFVHQGVIDNEDIILQNIPKNL